MTMPDITITRVPSMPPVACIDGQTDDGIEFIDTFSRAKMEVFDAGAIALRVEYLAEFKTEALAQGLTVEDDNG